MSLPKFANVPNSFYSELKTWKLSHCSRFFWRVIRTWFFLRRTSGGQYRNALLWAVLVRRLASIWCMMAPTEVSRNILFWMQWLLTPGTWSVVALLYGRWNTMWSITLTPMWTGWMMILMWNHFWEWAKHRRNSRCINISISISGFCTRWPMSSWFSFRIFWSISGARLAIYPWRKWIQ